MRQFVLAGLGGLALVPVSARADEPVVQPVQVGAETVRYQQGVSTTDLRQRLGAVQIRPLPMDHGSLAFAVAVFNGAGQPANIDLGNFAAQAGEQNLSVFTVRQLASKAKSRARWSQFGVAMLGGLAAGAAASQRDTYTSTLYTPRATYRAVYSAPSVAGQFQAAAITAGTGYALVEMQNRLDRTIEALGNDVVQTSTIDPGQTYGGKIVLAKIKSGSLPQRVTLTVSWNGESYPFAFQLAKEGTPAPVFTALTPPEAGRGMTTAPLAGTAMPGAPTLARFSPAQPANLDQIVRRTAEVMPRPTPLDDGSSITRFAATGTELTVTLARAGADPTATGSAICGQRALIPLLHQGATIRAAFTPARGAAKAEDLVVTGQTCGFY